MMMSQGFNSHPDADYIINIAEGDMPGPTAYDPESDTYMNLWNLYYCASQCYDVANSQWDGVTAYEMAQTGVDYNIGQNGG